MPSGSARAAERGFNLVGLAVTITIVNIMVAIALPLWSALIQRDKEEELVSRGFQIAEAIRVFQTRFGRLPNRLEEMLEVEPRTLRRLFEDPMTADGAWAVIVELPGQGLIALDSRTGQPIVPVDADGDGRPDPLPPPPPRPPGGGNPVVGPIHGVKSRASGDAFLKIFDQEDYGDWEFTVEVLQSAIAKPGPSGLPPRANGLTLGRPFRYPPPGSVDPEGGGRPGGGSGPGGKPPRPGPGPGPQGPPTSGDKG